MFSEYISAPSSLNCLMFEFVDQVVCSMNLGICLNLYKNYLRVIKLNVVYYRQLSRKLFIIDNKTEFC